MTDTPAFIAVQNVSKRFGPVHVLDRISLDIHRGESVVIVGGSGAGKTVLLKCMIGLLDPDAGQVLFDGTTITGLDEHAMARVRARFGFVFQGATLFDSLNVEENVGFALRQLTRKSRDEIRHIVDDRLREVGLDPDEVRAKMPAELSGGMRKRVGFARAVAVGPEVVLYDEPTTGLDPIMCDVVSDLILTIRRQHNVTSVVVTHDMRSAFKVADRIAMLQDGQLIADATPDHFRRHPDPRVRQFVEGRAAVHTDAGGDPRLKGTP